MATAPSGLTVQLNERIDRGAAETRKHYGAQIESTGTDSIIEAVSQSMKGNSGVFLSDSVKDWGEVLEVGAGADIMKVVVPDIEHFSKHLSDFPESVSRNGLTIQQNCGLAAEHELIHLRQANENLKSKKSGEKHKGATTGSKFFSKENYRATMGDLMGLSSNLEYMSGRQVHSLTGKAEYIRARLTYVTNTIEDQNRRRNSEAPAVMRELRSYLEAANLTKKSAGFTKFYNRIVELDEDCKESLGLPKPKTSWWPF